MIKKISFFSILVYGTAAIFILLNSGCSTTKQVTYFENIRDRNEAVLDSTASFTKPLIQSDDILSVNVFSLNPTTGSVVNQASNLPTLGNSQYTSAAAQASPGFLVDENGEIELTAIGKIKVAGLTTTQAKELIKEKAAKIYKNPNVQVRFMNFTITVLGEVNAPGTYTLPKEKVSILDAIGLAGDLSIYGKRNNILLIRDEEDRKEYKRLNLNSTDLFKSPFFYLKQNDVIYIEPTKAKASANNANRLQTLGVITSIVTVLVLLVTTLK